ncbi:hypothetical protein AOLI_G00070870 [Acnodon oligacanthus]
MAIFFLQWRKRASIALAALARTKSGEKSAGVARRRSLMEAALHHELKQRSMDSACDPLFLSIHCLLLQLLNGRCERRLREHGGADAFPALLRALQTPFNGFLANEGC